MAAYTYNDWNQQGTNAAKLTRLELHITEVSALIQADVSSDAKSRSTGNLMEYLKLLEANRDRLEARVNRVNGGLARVRFGRA